MTWEGYGDVGVVWGGHGGVRSHENGVVVWEG